MTREEAAGIIKECKDKGFKHTFYTLTEYHTALDMAIKALDREPKTGHWIYDDEYSDLLDAIYECSCCKRILIVPYEAKNEVYKNYPYCHCGAKMAESEET
jgi:hypothetical protein